MQTSDKQRPVHVPVINEHVQSLLDKKEYAAAAGKLLADQQTAKQQGNHSRAQRLLAAHQMCLTLHQQQQNVQMYHELYENAVKQEADFCNQLARLLYGHVVNEETVVSSPQLQPTTTLWQRLRHRFTKQDPVATEAIKEPAFVGSEEKGETAVSLPPTPSPPTDAKPSIAIHCMGSFRVFQNNERIDNWQGLKSIRILKYLVLHYPKSVQKDILMDQFWPDLTPESARRNLHQAIYSLRQALQSRDMDFQHILFENDAYRINPQIDLWIDFIEMQKHITASRQLEQSGQIDKAIAELSIAESIYLGKFMPGELYDAEWAMSMREQLHLLYLDLTDQLCTYYIQKNEHTAAISLCHKVLKFDNCHEDAHRRLMLCYHAQNQRHMAIRQFKTCLQALKSELDLPPAPETIQLYQQLLAP